MFLKRSVSKPQPHHKFSESPKATPDYIALVKFLIGPFLEDPETLRVDCEEYYGGSRVWIRIAFDSADKGKVFGRGGRNIQAIRTAIAAAAEAVNQSVFLEIYGSNGSQDEALSDEAPPERLPPPKLKPKADGYDRPRLAAKFRSSY